MRTLWASLVFAWLAVAPAGAEVTAADREAIERAVRGQIAAFQRDDAEAAYGFASATIQRLFATPELFLEMVRRAYAPLYRLAEARFSPPVADESVIRQKVVLRGPDGRFWVALYAMQRQPDGSFRIDGCTLEAMPGNET